MPRLDVTGTAGVDPLTVAVKTLDHLTVRREAAPPEPDWGIAA